jgi:hypothetical protein
MTVQELIELLKQMPQDARVEIGTYESLPTEPTHVKLEKYANEYYVFIGDY